MRSSDFVLNQTDGIKWLSFPSLEVYPFLVHGFLIRSPNLSKDAQGKQAGNLLKKITSQERFLIYLTQTHQDECIIITPGDELKESYRGDAILTTRDDLFISVWVADCLPIFLVEKRRRVIGLVHAGWRGTLMGIARRTLKKAKHRIGSKPKDFTVLLGPCIQRCCYQVSDDVAILFDKECVNRDANDRFTLDLVCANMKQLVGCGVQEDKIFVVDMCTFCQYELFHSYRRDKDQSLRMIAFMGLR